MATDYSRYTLEDFQNQLGRKSMKQIHAFAVEIGHKLPAIPNAELLIRHLYSLVSAATTPQQKDPGPPSEPPVAPSLLAPRPEGGPRVSVRYTGLQPGRWRAGHRFTTKTEVFEPRHFTDREMAEIRADKTLQVREV